MTKDLSNVIVSVQEYFDDGITRQGMGLASVISETEGVLIEDTDGNKFRIKVEQL